MIKKIKNAFWDLKSFHWEMFIALCLLALVPAIFVTIRTSIISSEIDTSAIDIIGQMEWFDLTDETIKAFLIIPLYSILNRVFKKNNERFSKAVFKTLIVCLVFYMIFLLIVYINGENMVSYMNVQEIDINLISSYLKLETIAFAVGIIQSFVNVVLVVVEKSKNMYILLAVKCFCLIVCDFVLVPSFGVFGIAISNIFINSIIGAVGILMLVRNKHIKFSLRFADDKALYFNWLKIGIISGGQIFLNNIVYALMIVKMINMVSEQGNYWVANNFIWGWMLIPITALSEIIRSDCKNEYTNLKQSNYYIIVIFTIIVWLIFIPVYVPFLSGVEKLENAQLIFSIIMKLFCFYIAYAFSQIPNNIFIGLGKMKYIIIDSIIVNIFYYGIFFILVKTNAIIMNINTIIVMFGLGMIISFVINIIEEKLFLKKELSKNQAITNLTI